MARMFNPPHPRELLREFLPEGLTIEDVAGRLGVSRVQLSRVFNGRSVVSADMAIRVGLLTNTTAHCSAVSSRGVVISDLGGLIERIK
jgi:antitoxin HigA-1